MIIVNSWLIITIKCSILDVAVVLGPPLHMDACLNTSVHVVLIFHFSKSIKERSDFRSCIKSLRCTVNSYQFNLNLLEHIKRSKMDKILSIIESKNFDSNAESGFVDEQTFQR